MRDMKSLDKEPVVDLILASASPRRSELLRQIGVRFSVLAVDVDESRLPGESPVDYVSRLALEKARAGFARQPGQLPSLGADTIVVCGDDIFGKPVDQAHAAAMLLALSGKAHTVLSAVAVSQGPCSSSRLVETDVRFRTITESDCLNYWQTGEPHGKAGGYGIQGYGAVFVEYIEGSYSAVVGLPLSETAEILSEFGVPVWNARASGAN